MKTLVQDNAMRQASAPAATATSTSAHGATTAHAATKAPATSASAAAAHTSPLASATTVAAQARGLSKTYGSLRAVDGIDFTLHTGEVVAILGPNGAGKSTTIEMLMGLTQPDAGSLTVLGSKPGVAASHGKVAAMLQTGALLEDQTVAGMLKLIARLHGATERLEMLVRELDIAKLMPKRIRKCSGGERQKVRLAMSLLPNPSLLILDEPTAGLDPIARRSFWESMRRQADAGRTILFATHYLEEAEQFASRTIIMNKGHIIADGPTAEVRARAARQLLRGYIPPSEWPAIEQTLTAAAAQPSARLEWTFHEGSITIHGEDLRAIAVNLLTNPEVRGIELTNASLDEAFTTLTDAAESENNR